MNWRRWITTKLSINGLRLQKCLDRERNYVEKQLIVAICNHFHFLSIYFRFKKKSKLLNSPRFYIYVNYHRTDHRQIAGTNRIPLNCALATNMVLYNLKIEGKLFGLVHWLNNAGSTWNQGIWCYQNVKRGGLEFQGRFECIFMQFSFLERLKRLQTLSCLKLFLIKTKIKGSRWTRLGGHGRTTRTSARRS